MLPLRELQLRFARGLLSEAAEDITPWVLADGIDSGVRVAIYRHNVQAAFLKTLALEFPVLERLVGHDYFLRLGTEYQRAYPSRSGNLHYVGELFPEYLRDRFDDTEYSYFPDVAALEWAYQEALVAPDAPMFEPSMLQRIALENYPQLRMTLQPHCRLVRTRYPVIRIWRANQPGAEDTLGTIDLGSAADLILVCRSADCILFTALPSDQFALLESQERGLRLGEAMDVAMSENPRFDLGAALRRFISLGVFTDVFI